MTQKIYEIEDINDSGSGVLRINGKVYFAEGALTGDLIEVLEVREKKKYGLVTGFRIVQASHMRKTGLIEKFSAGYYLDLGMPLYPLEYQYELQHKQRSVFRTIKKISGQQGFKENPILDGGSPKNYRNKGSFPIRLDAGVVRIGMFKKGSHSIFEPSEFHLMPAEFAGIIAITREFLSHIPESVYPSESESSFGAKKRGIKHLIIRKGAEDSYLIGFSGLLKHRLDVTEYAATLQSKGINVSGIMQYNKRRDDQVIFGEDTLLLYGENKISENIGAARFEMSLESFFQVNTPAAEKLYAEANRMLAPMPGDLIWDIYCGVGSVGIYCLARAENGCGLMGNEVLKTAVSYAKINAGINSVGKAVFEAGRAEDIVPRWLLEEIRPSKIILDPPRKGVDGKLLKTIATAGAGAILYISCNPSTLARDIGVLAGKGYEPTEITPVDLFPGTANVEAVCLLRQVK